MSYIITYLYSLQRVGKCLDRQMSFFTNNVKLNGRQMAGLENVLINYALWNGWQMSGSVNV